MKVAFCLFFTLTLFFLYADAAFTEELPPDCSGFPKPACTKEYMPHCASNGITYANSCIFCNAHVKSGRIIKFRYYGICKK